MTTATLQRNQPSSRNSENRDCRVNRRTDARWLERTLDFVRSDGYAIVENVLDASFVSQARDALYRAQDAIKREPIAPRILELAGSFTVLRLTFKYEPFFFRFLELPEVLEIVDRTVSTTGILHTQNGLLLAPAKTGAVKKTFENQLHMDFARVLDGYMGSINTLFAIDDFTRENGGTLIVPGSHQQPTRPSDEELQSRMISTVCPAGSMLVFDSTLYHASGRNESGKDRLGVNNQFTRAFFKPQIDWVRALGDDVILRQSPRTQQLLGWYTRVPTSLDEYYRPEAERLYRKNQG